MATTYTPQQIQRVIANPNEYPPRLIAEMINAGCLKFEDLPKLTPAQENFIKTHLGKLQEENDYQACLKEDATYDKLSSFIDKYPKSPYRSQIENKLIPMREDRRVYDNLINDLSNASSLESKLTLVRNFRLQYPSNIFIANLDKLEQDIEAQFAAARAREEAETQRRRAEEEAEARRRQEEAERLAMQRAVQAADEQAWNQVLALIENPQVSVGEKLSALANYEMRYSIHIAEVPSKREVINNQGAAMSNIMAVLNDSHSDVVDYINLYNRYPSHKNFMKDWMIQDMKVNPSKYDREEMGWLLNGKDGCGPIFSIDELVQARVAPFEIFNHVVNFPTDKDDRDKLEDTLQPETNFTSEENNTDVYFFGVPGSGKTTVLAGLFNLDRYENIKLHLPLRGEHIGYSYASILRNYLSRNVFPQRTKTKFAKKISVHTNDVPVGNEDPFNSFDNGNESLGVMQGSEVGDKFIQIIDAEISFTDSSTKHKLSLIEMPGERTLDFAVADMRDLESMDRLLGTGTKELFMNNNRKVFFFIIDPDPARTYNVKINGNTIPVSQAKVLETLIDFIKQVPGLLAKVDAMHIILTKADMLRNQGSLECIRQDVISHGYENAVDELIRLCDPAFGNVNAQCGHKVHLFTFSLGKVYPGHMIKYIKDDSAKILRVIADNTYGVSTKPTKWESIVEWMNN